MTTWHGMLIMNSTQKFHIEEASLASNYHLLYKKKKEIREKMENEERSMKNEVCSL